MRTSFPFVAVEVRATQGWAPRGEPGPSWWRGARETTASRENDRGRSIPVDVVWTDTRLLVTGRHKVVANQLGDTVDQGVALEQLGEADHLHASELGGDALLQGGEVEGFEFEE